MRAFQPSKEQNFPDFGCQRKKYKKNMLNKLKVEFTRNFCLLKLNIFELEIQSVVLAMTIVWLNFERITMTKKYTFRDGFSINEQTTFFV